VHKFPSKSDHSKLQLKGQGCYLSEFVQHIHFHAENIQSIKVWLGACGSVLKYKQMFTAAENEFLVPYCSEYSQIEPELLATHIDWLSSDVCNFYTGNFLDELLVKYN